MTTSLRVAVVLVLSLSSACLKRIVTPPPETLVTLGGVKASARDWAKVGDLCAVDPKLVQADFESMDALLANFLGQTSAGPEGSWADEHVTLLEEAQRVLPTPLDLQKRALNQAGKAGCRFEGLHRTGELTDMAKKRLAEAPELLEMVRARKALAAWKDGLRATQAAANERVCAAKKPSGGPVVFAAFEDERGRTEWLFCDGSKVAAAPGSLPAWEPPPADAAAKKAKKPPEPKSYLDAQAKYPRSEVSRAPKLPVKKLVRPDDGPEPE